MANLREMPIKFVNNIVLVGDCAGFGTERTWKLDLALIAAAGSVDKSPHARRFTTHFSEAVDEKLLSGGDDCHSKAFECLVVFDLVLTRIRFAIPAVQFSDGSSEAPKTRSEMETFGSLTWVPMYSRTRIIVGTTDDTAENSKRIICVFGTMDFGPTCGAEAFPKSSDSPSAVISGDDIRTGNWDGCDMSS